MSLGFSLLFLSHTLPCWPTLLDLTMVVTHLTSAHSPFFVRVLYQFAAMPFWRTAAGPATCSLLVYPLRRIAPDGLPNAYDSQIATSFFYVVESASIRISSTILQIPWSLCAQPMLCITTTSLLVAQSKKRCPFVSVKQTAHNLEHNQCSEDKMLNRKP